MQDDLHQALSSLNYGPPTLLLTQPPSTIYTTPTTLLHLIQAHPIPYPPPQTLPSSTNQGLLPVHRVISLPPFANTVVWATHSEKGGWKRLGSIVRRHGKLGEVEGRRVAWALVDAVAKLHRIGRKHGCIKVEMLFVSAANVFLANGVNVGAGINNFEKEEKKDAWDLGCVMYWLWTGLRPFGSGVGVGQQEVMFPEGLGGEKKRVLKRMLERDGMKRATVLEIWADSFWGAFRDKGIMETVSATGSGGDSQCSRRRSSAAGSSEGGSAKRKDGEIGSTEVEVVQNSCSPSTEQECAAACSTTTSTTTAGDYAVDGWTDESSRFTFDQRKIGDTQGGPNSPTSIINSDQALAMRIRHPLQGFKVKDRRYNLKLYKNVFVGKEAVTWLIDNKVAQTRTEAVYIGQTLLQAGEFRHCVGEHGFKDEYLFYTFEKTKKTGDMTEFRKTIVLNGNIQWRSKNTARDPVELSEALLKDLVQLCLDYRFLSSVGGRESAEEERPRRRSSAWRQFLTSDESEAFEQFPFEPSENIDYVSLRKSREFDKFELATAELRATDLTKVRSRQEKAAFAINLYNLLALHARILQGAPMNRSDRIRFFRKTLYKVGLVQFTLDDLLHGILRGNKRSQNAVSKHKQFFYSSRSEAAIKKSLVVKPVMLEALCAVNSTSPYDPPIRAMNEDNVDALTKETAGWFIKRWVTIEKRYPYADYAKGNVSGGRVTTLSLSATVNPLALVLTARLPLLFDTYRGDFKNSAELVKWTAEKGDVKELKDCKALIYWGWDFGQCIGDEDGKIPMCPMFWSDTLVKK